MGRLGKIVGVAGFSRHGGKALLTALLAAISFSPDRAAAAGLSISAEKPFGYAWYDLEHFAPDSLSSGSIRPMIRSQLDFPLDPFRITLGWGSERGGDDGRGPALRAGAEAWISVGPSYFRMRDQDWTGLNSSSGVSNSNLLVKFSDTYSKAGTLLFGARLERELTTWSFLGEPFAIGLGAGGWRYAYELFGFDGKQLSPDDGSWKHVSASEDLRVGTYETWSAHPILGLRTLERILGLDWKARLHPITYSSALDDHLLRMKRIEMSCLGTGGSLEASRAAGAHWMPYARFELERSWGRMRQTYYADSPDSPDDETGQSFSGIRTTVNAWALALGLRWNWH